MAELGKTVQTIDLNIGQTITCLFNKVLKIDVQLVGFVEQEFLILHFPYIGGIRSQLSYNTPFAAHLRLSQSLIFFSSIVEYVYEKKKLVICSYPASFKVFEARVSKRIPCFMPIALSANDIYMLAVTQDISENGCHLIIQTSHYKKARAIQLKDALTMELASGTAGTLLIDAEVVYVRHCLATTRLGLHFTAIANDDSIRLHHLIQSHYHEIAR